MRGVSLHIGLNRVDPNHYAGWNGSLLACENDARDMATIAQHQGFEATLLLTQQARATNVLDRLHTATEELGAGDFFLITFAGHGAQVPDLNGDEADQLDETWVLYDRMLVDDELYAACSGFRAGIRVVIIADSCHSGTVLRGMVYQDLQNIPQLKSAYRDVVPQFRVMPQEALHSTYNLNITFYEQLQQQTRAANSRDVAGDLILLSACQDNQLAADGASNGLFTGTLKSVWRNGSFKGSYKTLWQGISHKMPPTQTPNFIALGPRAGDFESQSPFTISGWIKTKQEPNHESGQSSPTYLLKKENCMTSTSLADINGNWEEVSLALSERFRTSRGEEDFMSRTIEANSAAAQAIYFGTPNGQDVSVQTRGGTVARAFWWGFHVQISHQDLGTILNTADTVNALVSNIGGNIPSPAQPWIKLMAPFIAATHQLLRSLDRGRGIYISMSWFAPGIFIPTSV